MARLALAIALPCLTAATPPVRAAPSTQIERLEAVASRHPEDPDVAWALARRLAERGQSARAVEVLESYVARWPDRRSDAHLTLGRWLYDLGRDADAVRALENAVARDPGSGAARLHLSLALWRLGRHREAASQLQLAERLEPELRGQALLLRGMILLESGDEAGAESALRAAIDLDPEGDPGRSARLILGPEAEQPPRRIRLEAYSSVAYDSNVVLDGGTGAAGLARDRDDAVFQWGTAVIAQPVLTERGAVSVGYRYEQSAHLELSEYDTQKHLALASGRWRIGSRASVRLDGLFEHASLDEDPYALQATLRPHLFLSFGQRAGVLRLFAEGVWHAYEDEPIADSLERDGWSYGGGLEHAIPIPRWRDAWASLGASFSRLDTDGTVDALGFDSAYDHDRWRGLVRFRLPLAWGFRSNLLFSLGYERYENRNLIDFLTKIVSGAPATAVRREDLVSDLSIGLVRRLGRYVDAEVAYRYLNRSSNVALYDYDRSQVRFAMRVYTP
jgi:tetratricopeptide (TPR) repeat protein